MEINSENVEFHEEITDLEVKIELSGKTGNIKNEVFEEIKNSDSFRIVGEKRKNEEKLILENKKIKDEFVVFEESDYKQEPQTIEEPNLDDLNNQVNYIFQISQIEY